MKGFHFGIANIISMANSVRVSSLGTLYTSTPFFLLFSNSVHSSLTALMRVGGEYSGKAGMAATVATLRERHLLRHRRRRNGLSWTRDRYSYTYLHIKQTSYKPVESSCHDQYHWPVAKPTSVTTRYPGRKPCIAAVFPKEGLCSRP